MYELNGQEGRLSVDEFETMTTAANYLVNDHGKSAELLRVLFNQVMNECKKSNIDGIEILKEIRDHLNARINGPQTPDEFLSLYPDDEE
mgnify:CR=1 FL=1